MQNLFSYPLKIEDLTAAIRHYNLKADDKQLKYITDILKVPSVKSFEAEMEVQLHKKELHTLTVKGKACAKIEQTSIISLENFIKTYSTEFEVVFDTSLTAKDLQEMEFEFDDDVPDIVTEGQIDLAEIAMEQIALIIDDFPRQEGEVFEFTSEFDEETTKAANPFAVLEKLKK